MSRIVIDQATFSDMKFTGKVRGRWETETVGRRKCSQKYGLRNETNEIEVKSVTCQFLCRVAKIHNRDFTTRCFFVISLQLGYAESLVLNQCDWLFVDELRYRNRFASLSFFGHSRTGSEHIIITPLRLTGGAFWFLLHSLDPIRDVLKFTWN